MNYKMFLLVSVISIFFIRYVEATVRRVPIPYPTISDGIDAATSGDTVLIEDGTYVGIGNVMIFTGQDTITIASANGPQKCIIDGSGIYWGFYCEPSFGNRVTIEGLMFQNCSDADTYSMGSAIIHATDGTTAIENCVIHDCLSDKGFGGGITSSDGTLIAEYTTISQCRGGGAVSLYDTNFSLYSCVISDNSSGNGAWSSGGGLVFDHCNTSISSIDRCKVLNNFSRGYYGAGAAIGYSNVRILNSDFYGNVTTRYWHGSSGGGINIYNSHGQIIEIINCNIAGNYATEGSAINVDNYGGSLLISDSIIKGFLRDNSADAEHSTMRFRGTGSFTIFNCIFSECIRTYARECPNVTFINNLFLDNKSTTIKSSESSITLQNCSFPALPGTSEHHTIELTNHSTGVVTGSILWGSQQPIFCDNSSSVSVTYSDIEGGFSGIGNINLDPLFVSGPYGDYYLSQLAGGQSENSPCIDSGEVPAESVCFEYNSEFECLDALTTNILSIPDSGLVDMGFHYALSSGEDGLQGENQSFVKTIQYKSLMKK